MFEIFADQPLLPTIWFIVIGILFCGYLVLDGFDLGVGMLMSRPFSKTEKERRLLLNTIGPVWDGNEVWLITAGAGMFASFPFWYASLFSALYIPLTLLLVFLILRVVAIDYRGKQNNPRWISTWNTLLSLSSFGIAFLIGALLALTTTGIPLNERGNSIDIFAWATSPFTYLGGIAVVCFSLIQGLAFIALKTDGPIRYRARAVQRPLMLVGSAPLLIWALLLQWKGESAGMLSYILCLVGVLGLILGYISALQGREGRSFVGNSLFVCGSMLGIFLALYPTVLPSTLNPAHSLTVTNASSSPYTLTVMSWVVGIMLPLIIGYQCWSYYQFRQRMKVEHIPDAHDPTELGESNQAVTHRSRQKEPANSPKC